jgi:predicted nucleic acid-binding protein
VNSPICIDASIIIRLLVGGEGAEQVSTLWREWKTNDHQLVAPSLMPYEVANVLHQYVRHGALQPAEADEALQIALSLNIQLYRETALHTQAARLARELELPATYDAHYLALAQQIGAVFWTADQRLLQMVAHKLDFLRGI